MLVEVLVWLQAAVFANDWTVFYFLKYISYSNWRQFEKNIAFLSYIEVEKQIMQTNYFLKLYVFINLTVVCWTFKLLLGQLNIL